jgi:hypothetical protein
MRKSTKVILIFSLFLVLFSFSAYAESVVFNNPPSNATLNGTIVLDATTDYNCTIATFYYSNTSNPWQSSIGDNTTSDERNFTFIFDTNILSDGVYNFTVNVTNSTLENFTTSTNITIDNPPKWFNNINSIQSGSQYSPNQTYQFNITWTDGSLDTVFFESNYTLNASNPGSLLNYSYPTVFNYSGIFWINLTDLPAQTFVYRWIANDTSGNSNTTGNLTYTIAKNSSTTFSLTLNGTENNASFRQYQNATFTASLNVPNKTIFLNSSYPLWTNITNLGSFASNTINLTTLGNFSIISYWIGDENYSASNKTYYFNVTDLNFLGNNTTIPSGSNYSTTANYNFSINLTGSVSSIIFEADFLNGMQTYRTTNSTTYNNITIQNNSNVYWISFPALSANIGGYSYRWIANDTNNVWLNTSQMTYVINPLSVPISLGVNGGWTTTTSTPTNISCSATGYQLNLSLIGDCSVTGGNSVYCTYTTGSNDGGTTSFTCSVSPVYNYTGSAIGTLQWYKPSWSNDNSGGSSNNNQQTTGSFTITPSISNVTMEPNTSKIITITLRNTLSNGYVININLTASGLDSSWYSLDKTSITRLRNDGGNETVQLTLNVPSDAEAKAYSIVVTASGKDFSGNSLTRRTTITLTVPQAPQNATEETGNVTNATNATTNETAAGPTALLIKPEDVRNIALFLGIIAIGLVFIFRSNITSLFMKGYKPRHLEFKKPSAFSSIKNKIAKMKNYRFSIQLKRRRKLK